MQLDIFNDSRDTLLRNDVAVAIERRDAASAQRAWQALASEFPRDDALPALQRLVSVVECGPPSRFDTHDALHTARAALLDTTAPAAHRVFGAATGDAWLSVCWRELAQAAHALPFDAAHADDHAAPLWLRVADWQRASGAVRGIESWRRIPAPLAWMAEAQHRLAGPGAAWPLLAELAWLAPARFDALCRRLGDAALTRLRKSFDARFEGDVGSAVDDLAWFPAWVLTEQPALAPLLGLAQRSLHSAPELAMRLMLDLLALGRQGRHADIVERRRALRDTHAGLYAAYLKTR